MLLPPAPLMNFVNPADQMPTFCALLPGDRTGVDFSAVLDAERPAPRIGADPTASSLVAPQMTESATDQPTNDPADEVTSAPIAIIIEAPPIAAAAPQIEPRGDGIAQDPATSVAAMQQPLTRPPSLGSDVAPSTQRPVNPGAEKRISAPKVAMTNASESIDQHSASQISKDARVDEIPQKKMTVAQPPETSGPSPTVAEHSVTVDKIGADIDHAPPKHTHDLAPPPGAPVRMEAPAPAKSPPPSAGGATPSPAASVGVIIVESRQSGDGAIELRLDPPDLGRVTIDIAPDEQGGVRAIVTTERADTLDLVRRHIDIFRQELARHGIGDIALTFGDSRGQSSREETGPKPHRKWSAFDDAGFDGAMSGGAAGHFDVFA